MKLMNREPTEEMIEAGIKLYSSNGYTGGGIVFQAMYDAAPEIKIDMAPVAWFVKNGNVGRVLFHRYEVDEHVKEEGWKLGYALYSAEQVATLQAQLAERDKEIERLNAGWHGANVTILEQQARIEELRAGLQGHLKPKQLADIVSSIDASPALEAALKAERINTLKDAAGHFADTPKGREVKEELTRMANALKEQS